MRPVIKKKRIDPRYFLNETVNRGTLEEEPIMPISGPLPPSTSEVPTSAISEIYKKLHTKTIEEVKLSVRQKAEMDTDDDGDIDAKDLAALRGQEEHAKSDDEDDDGVRDPKDRPGVTLLKGEKTLYEKLRSAIEEVVGEYLEEEEIDEAARTSSREEQNAAAVAAARRAKGMKQAASGEWYTAKPGYSKPVDTTEREPGKRRADDYHKKVSGEGAFTNKRGGGN